MDKAGNSSASSAVTATIDTIGPVVTYDVAHYSADNHKLTIEGTGFLSLGTSNITELVKAHAGDLTWHTSADTVYTLAASDVVSATVADDRTIFLNLKSGGLGFADKVEQDAAFGSHGSTTLNPLDSIAIAATFVGTDTAGNKGTGFTAGINVLGQQNSVDMAHSYSANLVQSYDATDDTLGVDYVVADLTGNKASSLLISGSSAAQTMLEDYSSYGPDHNQYLLTQVNAFNKGSNSSVSVLSTHINDQVSFADGSILHTNAGGDSSTAAGGKFDDQLIAGDKGDRLLGNAGNDLLVGGNGSDALYGGSGNDVLFGGAGNDYLSGGSGHDTFIYLGSQGGQGYSDGYDVIYGFVGAKVANSSSDVINVVGGNAASLLAHSIQSGADTLVTINATSTIRLLGVNVDSLSASNFASHDVILNGYHYSSSIT